ncbi:Hypothetical protein D9617_2g054860 [Elsinoe fawcettii]|nr:Hypothetical protein D9617_2g054860 [Elsinoe fawcettii]
MELIEKSVGVFACTVVFLLLSVIVVLLRCTVRLRIGGFGLDDWFMATGATLLTVAFILILRACFQGVGMRDIHLGVQDYQNVRHSILTVQCIYLASLVFIKGSICLALIRLATSKKLLMVLYVVFAISVMYGVVAIISLLLLCKPLAATWGAVPGKCADPQTLVDISYFVSACSIFTDLACCILPYVILWNLQMARRLNASAGTIVRIFYIPVYTQTTDYAYNIADVVIWTVIESGTATIVASLPSLRPLVSNLALFRSSANGSKPTMPSKGATTRMSAGVKGDIEAGSDNIEMDDQHALVPEKGGILVNTTQVTVDRSNS